MVSEEEISIRRPENLLEAIDEVVAFENKIFEKPYSREEILKSSQEKSDLVVLIAYSGGLPVGFKVGHALSPRVFYSWIGGVSPAHGKQGIAKALMREQHKIVKKLGYEYIRTNTHNEFREMLILNIKSGFNVIGVYKSLKDDKQTIMLEMEI